MTVTADRLRELLHYDPETGAWTWVDDGSPAGWLDTSTGYHRVSIDGRSYYLHRLAWFWMTGTWVHRIDHRDTVRSNNRWANLREATQSTNGANRSVSVKSALGVKGVSRCKTTGRYRADITVLGKRFNLGRFDTIEAASEAYALAAAEHFGEFARAA